MALTKDKGIMLCEKQRPFMACNTEGDDDELIIIFFFPLYPLQALRINVDKATFI